jgi:hypothetical protein
MSDNPHKVAVRVGQWFEASASGWGLGVLVVLFAGFGGLLLGSGLAFGENLTPILGCARLCRPDPILRLRQCAMRS